MMASQVAIACGLPQGADMAVGQLPEDWSAWNTSLSHMELATNAFSGTLPAMWGAALSGLQLLDVSANVITGGPPLLYRCTAAC